MYQPQGPSTPKEEDRISALSDFLLYHILSFLPTKDTAVTSFLSKRWKPLFLSQLTLNVDDNDFPNTFTLYKFFNSFITNRDNTLPILSLNLKLSNGNYHNQILNCLKVVNLKTLSIDFLDCHLVSTLTSFFLTTKTWSVSVLKLRRLKLEDVPQVHLPLLKVLHMESVTFRHHECLWKLLSGVPNLEELEAKDLTVRTVYLPHSQRHVACFSKLVRANICGGMHILFDWLHNVEHLRIQVVPLQLGKCFMLQNMFHNLTHMELIFDNMLAALAKLKWSWLIKLLGNFPKLQTLIINQVDVVNNFGEGDWEDPKIVPECLLSHLTTCSLRNYSRINCVLQFAIYIMQNSRVLKTMAIQTAKFVDSSTKLQMLMELSLCPKNSVTCELLFI